jgi:hypothetical protein
MKKAYVVTDSKTELEILKKLLPEPIKKNIEFVVVASSSASSVSSSILMAKRLPVVLVIDAHTDDESMISERQDTLQYLLRQTAAYVPFKVLFAVPTIETIFFQDKSLLEQIINHKFTEIEWELAKYHPKKSLTYFLGENPLSKIVNNLTDKTIKVLQKHPFIIELVEFLSSVIDKKMITDN